MTFTILDLNEIFLDKKDRRRIKEKRNEFYNRIILDSQPELLEEALRKYSFLSVKSAISSVQQEAESEGITEREVIGRQISLTERGLQYIIDRIKSGEREIKHADLINLNRITSPESYKKHPNSYRRTEVLVGKHAPPKPEELNSLMEQFLYILNEVESNSIVKAAYAHHELVRIHPFSDGNGRVARLLENWILMSNLYVPTYIAQEERGRYIRLLSNSFNEINETGKITDMTLEFFYFTLEREERSLNELLEKVPYS